MLLYGSIIKYELSKHISCEYSFFSQDIEIGLPLFYEKTLLFSGHIVVVDNSNTLQIVHKYEDVIFVCHQNFTENILNSSNNLIIINDDISMTHVFNLIMQIFLKFNQWEVIMLENINNFSTFDKVFQDLELIVDQGVFLANPQFHFVSFTKKLLPDFPDLDLDQAQKMFVQPGFSALDSIREVFQYNIIDHCLHKNIFFNDSYIGRLGTFFSDNEDKNRFYTHVLNYLAKHLEELYALSGSFDRNTGSIQLLKKIFSNYIDDITVDSHLLLTTLKQNHYHEEDEYYLIQFLTNIKEGSYLYANYVGTQIEKKWRGICCIQKKGATLILINMTVFKQNESVDFFKELAQVIRDSMLTASISRRFFTMPNIYKAFQQTKIAFETGKKKDPSSWIYRFDHYTYDFLLESAKGDFSPEQICSPVLLQLREYDKKNNARLYETLFVYIKNQFNATASAKSLFIARSSFLSRMDQISKLTHVDLNDWKVCLYLMLSYEFYEIDKE